MAAGAVATPAGVSNSIAPSRLGTSGSDGERAIGEATTAMGRTVDEAVHDKAVLERKVGALRVRLAQERARALDRRAEAGRVAEEARRAERERARCIKKLCRLPQRHDRMVIGIPEPLASSLCPETTPTVPVGNGAANDRGGKRETKRMAIPGANGGRRRREKSADTDIDLTTVTFAVGGEEEEEGELDGTDGTAALMLLSSLGVGMSELTEREGELFGRLQGETMEMRRRARAAEKTEAEARAEADRLAAAMNATLECALSEGKRLKAETEAREVNFVMLWYVL